jgi:hypothetical protein
MSRWNYPDSGRNPADESAGRIASTNRGYASFTGTLGGGAVNHIDIGTYSRTSNRVPVGGHYGWDNRVPSHHANKSIGWNAQWNTPHAGTGPRHRGQTLSEPTIPTQRSINNRLSEKGKHKGKSPFADQIGKSTAAQQANTLTSSTPFWQTSKHQSVEPMIPSSTARSSDSVQRSHVLRERIGIQGVYEDLPIDLSLRTEVTKWAKMVGCQFPSKKHLANLSHAFSNTLEDTCVKNFRDSFQKALAPDSTFEEFQHPDCDKSMHRLLVQELEDRKIWLVTEVAARDLPGFRCTIINAKSPVDIGILVEFVGIELCLLMGEVELKVKEQLHYDMKSLCKNDVVAQALLFNFGLVLPGVLDICGVRGTVTGAAAVGHSSTSNSVAATLLKFRLPVLGEDWWVQGHAVRSGSAQESAAAATFYVLCEALDRARRVPIPGMVEHQACMLGNFVSDGLKLLASPNLRLERNSFSSQGMLFTAEFSQDSCKVFLTTHGLDIIFQSTSTWPSKQVVKMIGSAYDRCIDTAHVGSAFEALSKSECPALIVPVLVGQHKLFPLLVLVMKFVEGKPANIQMVTKPSALDGVVSTLKGLSEAKVVYADLRIANLWASEQEGILLLDWDSLCEERFLPLRRTFASRGVAIQIPLHKQQSLDFSIWQTSLLLWRPPGHSKDHTSHVFRGLLRRGGAKLFLAALWLEVTGAQDIIIADWAQFKDALAALSATPAPISMQDLAALRRKCGSKQPFCGLLHTFEDEAALEESNVERIIEQDQEDGWTSVTGMQEEGTGGSEGEGD